MYSKELNTQTWSVWTPVCKCSKKPKGVNNSKIHWQMNGYKQCYIHLSVQFGSVQSLSCVRLFATPWIPARQASLSITNSRSSPRLTSIESVCHPAISSSVGPFSSCPQSLPASESFLMSQLFIWGGQSTGVSALASFPSSPLNTASTDKRLFQYP